MRSKNLLSSYFIEDFTEKINNNELIAYNGAQLSKLFYDFLCAFGSKSKGQGKRYPTIVVS